MTTKRTLLSVLGLMAILTGPAAAQTWSKAQLEVWDTVLESYKDIDAQDANWSQKWVFSDAMVWGPTFPMPRGRDSVKRWDAYQFPNSKNHVSEYSPAAIVVHDSTAVAHYYYSNASEDKDGERATTHGRCTDVLAKDGKKWRFIAWHCGDEPSDD
ncbi:MAG: nuclear transport factor 2 family protein [Gammaproteobacteria bacterium]|nr:nuclear transport factor 2 family protein [Gammaproteobacteria bacterium]